MRFYSLSASALIGALVLLACPSLGQAESLREALRAALQNHPTVESALASRDVVKQEEREEYSALFPEINASATGGRIFGDNSTSRGLVTTRGTSYSWLWEGNASVSQPIFDGLETLNRIDAARARLSSSNYEVSDTKENLGLRAVQAYLNVLRTEEAQRDIKKYNETLHGYMDRIHTMVDEGAADDSEAKQAENIVKLLESRIAQFEGDVQRAHAEYQEVIGHLPDGALSKPSAMHDLVYKNLQDSVGYALDHHPLILASEKEMEAAAYDIDAEKGTIYPDLSGELSYLKKDQIEELGGEVLDQRALLRLNWQFSTGGAQLARIKRSKAEYSEALARSRETKRQVERDVRQAHADAKTAETQLELLRDREEIVAALFETYQVQFEGSRVRLLQLMQAENQLFSTRLEKLNTEYIYLASQYSLLAGMGMLLQSLDADPQYPKKASVIKIDAAPSSDGFVYPETQKQNTETMKKMESMITGAKAEPEVSEKVTPVAKEEVVSPMPVPEPKMPEVKEDVVEEEVSPAPVINMTPMPEPEEMKAPALSPVEPMEPEPVKMQAPKQRNVYPTEDYNAAPIIPDSGEKIYPIEDYPGFAH